MTDRDKQVKVWLAGEVAKLQSESQQEDWLTLREAINDKALMSVPNDVFTLHMQFIHLQLLMGCVVKCCSGGLVEMRRNPERYRKHMDELTGPIYEFVNSIECGESLASKYNTAWGSSATRAGAAMLGVLQKEGLSTAMSSSAVQFLEQHVVATYVAYKEAVERAYGAGEPPAKANLSSGETMPGTPVARTGQGCLVCVAGCAVGGWAVLQMLQVIYAS